MNRSCCSSADTDLSPDSQSGKALLVLFCVESFLHALRDVSCDARRALTRAGAAVRGDVPGLVCAVKDVMNSRRCCNSQIKAYYENMV